MKATDVEAAFERAAMQAAKASARVDRRIESLIARDVPTFLEAPLVELGGTYDADVVVLGLPFEGVTTKDPVSFYPPGAGPVPHPDDHYCRSGADAAPLAIRRGSMFNSLRHSNGNLPEYGLRLGETLEIVDAGDLALAGLSPETAAERSADAIASISSAGAVPVVLGGDHTISGFVLAGLQEAGIERVGVIVYDSHLDLTWTPRLWAGSQWARAMEAGILEPTNLVQIGIRGSRNAIVFEEVARELGVTYFTIPEIDQLGIAEVNRRALEQASDGVDALYVSLDVDVIDPAFCPAQKYPDSGGITAREIFSSLRQVITEGPKPVGFDVACFGPAYDVRYAGSVFAARAVLEVLASMALRTHVKTSS